MRTAERKMELQLTASGRTPWKRAVTFGVELTARILRSLRHRTDANRLNEMDDWQLADIGLVRSDLKDAFEGEFLENPTLHLARAAQIRARTRFIRQRRS